MTAVVLRRRSDSRTGHVAEVGDVLSASPPRRYVRVVGIAVLVVAQCRRRSFSCCCRVCRRWRRSNLAANYRLRTLDLRRQVLCYSVDGSCREMYPIQLKIAVTDAAVADCK